MAVVKASYAKRGSSGAVRYALHREAEVGEGERSGFTADREGLDTRQSVAELKAHEEGKNYTYHMILNPGDGQDTRTNLQQWTRDTMRELENKHGREIPYVAVVHDDHSNHAHVHVVAQTERTLNRGELNQMRLEASRLYDRQRDLRRDLDHTLGSQHQGMEAGKDAPPQLKEGPGKEFAERFAQRYEERQARLTELQAQRDERREDQQGQQRATWRENAAKLSGHDRSANQAGGAGQERQDDEAKQPKKQRQMEWGR